MAYQSSVKEHHILGFFSKGGGSLPQMEFRKPRCYKITVRFIFVSFCKCNFNQYQKLDLKVISRAGRSPTFQDLGTPLNGLRVTWVPVNLTEQILSFKTSPCCQDDSSKTFYPDSRVSRRLAGTRVPGYPFQL